MKRFSLLALVALSVAGLAGCYKNPTIAVPPGPPPHLYTSDFGLGIITYAQPVGPSSTPALTLTNASLGVTLTNGVGSDAGGNFYLVDQITNTIYRFASPLTASSTIAQATTIGPPAGAGAIRRFGFDPQGNLWAADSSTNMVYEWKPPFGAALADFTITAAVPALANPLQPVFDNAGHMFVANFANATLEVFAFPGISPTPTAGAVIATCANPVDNALDVQHRVFITCASDPGDIQVFTPPYATGNLPAFKIASPFSHAIIHPPISGQAIRFDASGNLYVSFTAPVNTLAVYGPPFSAASIPLFTLTAPQITSMAFAN